MRTFAVLLSALLLAAAPRAQPQRSQVTTPKQAFGFDIGDDYQLASYRQIEAYWKTLDRQSDRLALHDMGRTAEGRTQWMAVVTSPENHRRLDEYRSIARRLALADGLDDAAAHRLAASGKAIVWIDGGLHASET